MVFTFFFSGVEKQGGESRLFGVEVMGRNKEVK